MQARGYAELTTIELPDELRFTVVRQVTARSWLYGSVRQALTYIFVSLVLIAICWICGWRSRDYLFALYLSAGMYIVSLFEPTLYNSVSELRITTEELVATLNPRKGLFSREDTVAIYRVASLGWRGGGLLLEIDSFWKRDIRILPGLNKEEGTAVLDTICKRFPEFWEEHFGAGWKGIKPSSASTADDEGFNAKL